MNTPKNVVRKVQSLEGAVLQALSKPRQSNIYTVRLRAQGAVDRHLIVEKIPGPRRGRSVLLRVTPASDVPLPAVAPPMLTTQEAADRLNVSRPYVTQLVDAGRFKDVVRTQSGHRRIPLAEVERVEKEMRTTRRAALDEAAGITRHLRERELNEARTKAKRRWVAKST